MQLDMSSGRMMQGVRSSSCKAEMEESRGKQNKARQARANGNGAAVQRRQYEEQCQFTAGCTGTDGQRRTILTVQGSRPERQERRRGYAG